MQATPATWRLLLDSGWQDGQGLKILCGGEALTRQLADSLLATGAQVWNMYGPTETTIWSTMHRVGLQGDPIPIGRPIANTTVYILDQNRLPVPVNVAGELYIGGVGLARGYHNRPELTAERFVANPFASDADARLYRTGDQVRYRADSTIEYLGRLDHQVKVRGFRIELGEIESVLATHQRIQQAVVLAREDVPGDQRIVAYLLATPGDDFVDSQLRSWLSERLPQFMVPSTFVLLDSIPMTPNGKVDRRALPAPQGIAQTSSTFVSPRAGVESAVADIWCEVLRVERVGADDNFFDLGGHSLLVVQLQSKLRERFQRDLSLMELFRRPTVGAIAEYLSDSKTLATPASTTDRARQLAQRQNLAVAGD
jgi:acyl-coenzyme A synthetase/AMP-(fatty) acid ligase/acyl carrier protein